MVNVDTVYVVISRFKSGNIFIESIWSSRALAESAILYYENLTLKSQDLKIIERRVNTTHNEEINK